MPTEQLYSINRIAKKDGYYPFQKTLIGKVGRIKQSDWELRMSLKGQWRVRRFLIISFLIISLSGCSTWSKRDKNLGLASCIMTVADGYTCHKAQNNPKNYDINPALGKHPSGARIVFVGAGLQAIVLTAAHFIPSWRSWILGGATVVRTGGTISNLRLDWKEDKPVTRRR